MYQRQVHDLLQLWSKVEVDREDFFLAFASQCNELPFTEYDLDSASKKAQTEWTEDIMVATADFNLKWYD